jgi:N-acetyl-gamma-glutamylphosphate reductase
MKAKVGIFGGAGYTGGELIRLLLRHNAAEIMKVKFLFFLLYERAEM